MTNPPATKPNPDKPQPYQIRLAGHLNPQWADWFGDVIITLEDNGETLLTCPELDQAALHGVLRKVRDLGVPLLAVIRLEPDQDDSPDANP